MHWKTRICLRIRLLCLCEDELGATHGASFKALLINGATMRDRESSQKIEPQRCAFQDRKVERGGLGSSATINPEGANLRLQRAQNRVCRGF